MAFELTVQCERLVPEDLRERWAIALAKHGIACEICPGFSPRSWEGGFLPFRVDAMPARLIDAELDSPAISGFEVYFNDQNVFFRSALGRTCTEFALLCLCAAELAIMTGGYYEDPQPGKSHSGDAAVEAALKEIADTLAYPGSAHRTQYRFEEWS